MIHGFREGRGLPPRLGKIRLGVKRQGQSGHEYPADTDHFVLTDAPGVKERYGPNPKSLVVMFASDDLETNFMTRLEAWKASSKQKMPDGSPKSILFCSSDGVQARRLYVGERDAQGHAIVTKMSPTERPDPGEYFEMDCPYEECSYYEEKGCKRVGRLNVVLPEVSLSGIFQIETSSAYGWGNILDMIDPTPDGTGDPKGWAMKMTRSEDYPQGHIAWRVPFELYREAQAMSPKEMQGKAIIKHVLRLRMIDSPEKLKALRISVPPWMLPGGSLLALSAPPADRPEDLFPGRAQAALPPVPGLEETAAPQQPDEIETLAASAGINQAKLAMIKARCKGDVDAIMKVLRDEIARRGAPPQPVPTRRKAAAAPAADPTAPAAAPAEAAPEPDESIPGPSQPMLDF